MSEKACPDGNGQESSEWLRCTRCGGTGKVEVERYTLVLSKKERRPLPRRRHVLTMEISGDTRDDVVERLRNTLQYIEMYERGPGMDLTSGGVTASAQARWTEDKSVTGESYQAACKRWRDQNPRPVPQPLPEKLP